MPGRPADRRKAMLSESLHTPASDWCPRPEHWHSRDGMATEREVSDLLWGLTRALQPEIVVETGAYMGDASQAIGRALDRNGHGLLYTIDRDQSQVDYVVRYCRDLPVLVTCGDSLTWTPPEPIDLAFLDSGLLERPREVCRYWSSFRPGAVVVIHDTAPHHYSPDQVRDMTHGCPSLNLHTPRGVLLFQVPS